MIIEKYKSPVGDGNSFFVLQIFAEVIEKYKSPVGDGNRNILILIK